MSLRRSLPDPADALRAAVPVALLLAAAAVPAASPVVLGLLVFGLSVAAARGTPVRWAWAATVPVAAALTWALVAPAAADPTGADCVTPGSPPAVWGLAQAALVLAVVAGLVTLLRTTPREIAIRWPARYAVRWAILGGGALAIAGLVTLAVLSGPVLGDPVRVSGLGIVLPALVYAVAGGIGEEVAYRGALLHWLARNTGPWIAVVAQAVVYGTAHGVADAGTPLLSGVLLGAAALVAGLITIRTRSLLVPIAWHVALNVPLYAWLACRG